MKPPARYSVKEMNARFLASKGNEVKHGTGGKKRGRPLWKVTCSAIPSHSYDQFNEEKPGTRCRKCGATATVTHLAKLQASIEKLTAPKPKKPKDPDESEPTPFPNGRCVCGHGQALHQWRPSTRSAMGEQTGGCTASGGACPCRAFESKAKPNPEIPKEKPGMSEIEVSKVKVAKNRKARPEAVIALAESIDEIGLLNPIILDDDNNLIAGLHRLMAHKHLALKDPDFKVIEFRRSSLDDLGRELARIDENLCRNQMTASERMDALSDRKAVWEKLHPETKQGGAPGKKGGGKKAKTELSSGFARDTAKKIGTTDRSVRQYTQAAKTIDPEAKAAIEEIPAEQSPGISELVELGRHGPEQQREIVARVAKTGETVPQAIKRMKRAEQVAQVRVYQPPAGDYGIVVFDYPWKFDDARDGSEKSRSGADYPKMTLEEICAFPLPVAENCLLACWIPNALLIDGTWEKIRLSLEQRYGAKPKQMRTWRKTGEDGGEVTGLGKAFRNDTEHLVLLERGTVTYVETGKAHEVPILRTGFDAPRGRGSEKPQVAYDQLAAICPMRPMIDVFAREGNERPGWVTTGSELPPKRQGWVEQAASKEEPKQEPTDTIDDLLKVIGPGSDPAPTFELDWKSANDGTEDEIAHAATSALPVIVYRVGAAGGKGPRVFHAKAGSAFLPGSWGSAGEARAAAENEERRRRAFGSEPSKKKRSRKLGPLDPLESEVA